MTYQSKGYSPELLDELGAQYLQLLQQFLAEPDRPLGELSLLTAEASAVVPDPSRPLPAPDPADPTTVVSMFLAQAARRPEAPAVRAAGHTWSYADLARRADGISAALRYLGVAAGDVVAVRTVRGPALAAVVLGVLSAGAVFLPIDGRLPQARRQQLADQVGAAAEVRFGTAKAGTAGRPTGKVLWVDAVTADVAAPELSRGDASPVTTTAPSSADFAYLFFTSGTTGVPKAVWGRHSGLVHFLSWQARQFGIVDEDRVAQLTAASFDPFLRDVLLPLTTGAVLCIPNEETISSPESVLGWLSREGVTVLHAVPSLTAWWLTAAPAERLSQLRLTFFAGEPLTDSLVSAWRSLLPEHAEIVNLYGPTETTQAKCHYQVPDAPLPGIQPVGRAIDGAQALVLGPHGLCGVGEIGEICIRTPFRAVVPGDKTSFVINQAANTADDLLYRTGDLGRYRVDGQLEILGRLDHQIKIHGVRINPPEVAALLAHHPLVEDCVVLGQRDGATVRLAAYVTLRPRSEGFTRDGAPQIPPAENLRNWALDRLPRVMVPSQVTVLDRLPLTANGKVDRRALPAPPTGVAKTGRASSSRTERQVGALAGQILGRAALGPDDDFFDLGGHSLLVTRLLSRIEAELGVRPSFEKVFRHPTPAAISVQVERLLSVTGAESGGPVAGPGGVPGPAPRNLSDREADVLLSILEPTAPSPVTSVPQNSGLEKSSLGKGN